MPIATRNDTVISPTITQVNLNTALQTAFLNAGFSSAFDSFTSGSDLCTVYEYITNSGATQGRVYIRIRITTALVIGFQIFAGFNAATDTGTNGSTEVTYSALSASTQITLCALNGGSEYRLIALVQGTTLIPLGVFSPATRPDWWSLNAWNYAFIPTSSNFSTWRGVASALSPYAITDYTLLGANLSNLSNVSPQTNRPDTFKAPILMSGSQGIAGQFSNEIVLGCFTGQTRLASSTPINTTEQYVILQNGAGGLGVRIA